MAPAPAARIDKLTKEYRVHERAPGLAAALRSIVRRKEKIVRAVSELSFTIEVGERVGFLGPNGAGKTTTLKMLAGLLHPTSGEATVEGFVPSRREDAFLKSITLVMGQKQQLLWDLPPADTFAQNRAIYDVSDADFESTRKELDELLELGDLVNKPTRQLSLGERMKCELAAALLHRPRVLFLDEPTIGLDVSMQLAVRDFIRRYNEQRGATVILTSHDMDDVASLCERVIVIDEGSLKYDGDLRALVHRVRPDKRVAFKLGGAADREALEKLGKIVEEAPGRVVLQIKRDDLREAISHALATMNVTDLTVEDPPLEEVMRELFAHGSPVT